MGGRVLGYAVDGCSVEGFAEVGKGVCWGAVVVLNDDEGRLPCVVADEDGEDTMLLPMSSSCLFELTITDTIVTSRITNRSAVH